MIVRNTAGSMATIVSEQMFILLFYGLLSKYTIVKRVTCNVYQIRIHTHLLSFIWYNHPKAVQCSNYITYFMIWTKVSILFGVARRPTLDVYAKSFQILHNRTLKFANAIYRFCLFDATIFSLFKLERVIGSLTCVFACVACLFTIHPPLTQVHTHFH